MFDDARLHEAGFFFWVGGGGLNKSPKYSKPKVVRFLFV